MDTTRQLLVAALALKRGLIDSARFVEVTNSEASRSPGELLMQRGWITPEQRLDLESEAQHQLVGKDTPVGAVAVSPEDARKALAFLASTTDDTVDEPPPPGRYRRMKLHGQGGMGDVWQARDGQMGRQVALKELKAKHEGNLMLRSRFFAEARITGQLEHPGIVPVYEVIERDDEPPSYTMRLVRGRTLTEAVREYHGKQTGNVVVLRDLLQAFVAVCNTLAYAHSRGVVHRDLKGANVVLGPYGEVVVLDWGLAKVLTKGESTEEPVRPLAEGDLEETEEGRVGGTPGYMAPEQALGQVERIDRRTDIFGLGAVLYEILTGRPPYKGADKAEVLRQAREGKVTPPRQVVGQVPKALEAVCLKALAKEREGRYATAEELADEVKHWLADELVRAHRESVLVRTRRWGRKHPKTVAALAATVLVGLLGAGTGTVVLGWKNRQLEEAHAGAVARLGQVEKANEILGSIFDDLDPKAEEKEGKTLREILGARLDRATAALDGEAIGDPLTVATMQHRLGLSQLGLGYPAKAVILFQKAVETRASELGDDHSDTLFSCDRLASAYREVGKLDQAITLFERTLEACESRLGEDHHTTLATRGNLALAYQAAGKLGLAITLLERTLKVSVSKLGNDHPDTLTSCNNLAAAYRAAGKLDLAIPLHERTLKAQESKLGADHPSTLISRNNLAGVYRAAGRPELAIPLHERTLKTFEAKYGDDHPNTLTSRNNLAMAYQESGKPGQAIPLHQRVLNASETKLGADHPSTLTSRNNLALAYLRNNQLDLAIPLHERTLKAQESKLGDDHPDTLTSRANLALAYWWNNQLDRSVPLHEDLLRRMRAKLGDDHPHTFVAAFNLGENYREAGKMQEAVAVFDEWLPRAGVALKSGQPLLHGGRQAAAETYTRAGRFDKAVALLSEAVAAARKQAKPGDPRLAGALAQLGNALLKAGKPAEAEPVLRECLALFEKRKPDAWTTSNAKSLLGEALSAQKKHADAEPLLLAGYQGLKERQDKIPPIYRRTRLEEALGRIVQMCDALGKADDAAKWRQELAALKASDTKAKP